MDGWRGATGWRTFCVEQGSDYSVSAGSRLSQVVMLQCGLSEQWDGLMLCPYVSLATRYAVVAFNRFDDDAEHAGHVNGARASDSWRDEGGMGLSRMPKPPLRMSLPALEAFASEWHVCVLLLSFFFCTCGECILPCAKWPRANMPTWLSEWLTAHGCSWDHSARPCRPLAIVCCVDVDDDDVPLALNIGSCRSCRLFMLLHRSLLLFHPCSLSRCAAALMFCLQRNSTTCWRKWSGVTAPAAQNSNRGTESSASETR
jgi:hypothetical protein